jgi:DNA repair protein RecO (recombination protein O)
VSVADRVLHDTALVLHVSPYRETSLFLDALSEGHGRLRLLAKGARRGRLPLSRLLTPFNTLSLSFTRRGDPPILVGAEQLMPGPTLRGRAMFCGFYVSELVMKLLPLQDACPGVFELCQLTLRQLENHQAEEQTLRFFEVRLLGELGYGPRLDDDDQGQAINAERRYTYDVEQGPSVDLAGKRNTLGGSTLLALARQSQMNQTELSEAKRLMRSIIHYHLNGRPLRSRELFRPIIKSAQA